MSAADGIGYVTARVDDEGMLRIQGDWSLAVYPTSGNSINVAPAFKEVR